MSEKRSSDCFLLSEGDIRLLVIDSLYSKGLISRDIYEKCGKVHISMLPYDNRTNDTDKLIVRRDAIIDNISSSNESLRELNESRENLSQEYDKVNEDIELSEVALNRSSELLNSSMESTSDTIDDLSSHFSRTRWGIIMSGLNGEPVELTEEEEGPKLSYKLYEYLQSLEVDWDALYSDLKESIKSGEGMDTVSLDNYSKNLSNFYDFLQSIDTSFLPPEFVEGVNNLVDNNRFTVLYRNQQQSNDKYKGLIDDRENIQSLLKDTDKEITRTLNRINDYEIELDKVEIKL